MQIIFKPQGFLAVRLNNEENTSFLRKNPDSYSDFSSIAHFLLCCSKMDFISLNNMFSQLGSNRLFFLDIPMIQRVKLFNYEKNSNK